MGHVQDPAKPSLESKFYSTNLNPRIVTYSSLAERIALTLGYPQVNIEAHQDQVLDNISIAIEMFSKFAGYTEEFLVFKSELYERGKGIPIDKLFSMSPEMSEKIPDKTVSASKGNTYVATVGNGRDRVVTVGHNLGTRDLIVSVRDNTTQVEVIASCVMASDDTIELHFIETPDSDQYNVTIIACGIESQTTTTTGPTYVNTFGDNKNYTIPVPHSLGTENIVFTVRDTQTDQLVMVSAKTKGADVVEIDFSELPMINQYQFSAVVTDYTKKIGDGKAVTFDVKHNTGTKNIVYSIRDNNTNQFVYVRSEIVDENILRFQFDEPPTSNQYTVSIVSSNKSTNTESTTVNSVSGGWDYDLKDYRKVIDVFSFEEGSTTGINTLFTLEQTLAQQTYFSYALGKYGFDLVSWYTLKNWLDVRSKLLSQEHYYKFDERRQRLYLTPEPVGKNRSSFYGLIGAYVEKPVRDLVKEPWVYQYSLALTKITIARVRGKYAGTALFGGGTLNYQDLLSEGLQEKEKLEASLYEGTAGLGDAAPPMFFVG